MSFFAELKASLEEAVEIKNGTKAPAHVTRYERASVAIKGCLSSTKGETAKPLS